VFEKNTFEFAFKKYSLHQGYLLAMIVFELRIDDSPYNPGKREV
jgi:hypothetical protein